MGLAIVVGSLAEVLADDPDFVEEIQQDFETINSLLRANSLPDHREPDSMPDLDSRAPEDSFPYSFLHYLRRVYAHAVEKPGVAPPALREGEDAADDPVIDRVSSPAHHLLWHSDAEGYYLPIDFPEVIESEERPGGGIGSTQCLLRELVYVAPSLGIQLDESTLSDVEAARIAEVIEAEGPNHVELIVWIALFEAARLSLEHKTAIQFC